ncbi:MAG TPA: hypothetical protein VF190_12780 [Rhodothermales bacterium]
MLVAVPKNILANDYHIERDGQRVAFLDTALFKRQGTIEIGGKLLRVERKGLVRPDFKLYLNDAEIARAHKPAILRDAVRLQLGETECIIRRKHLFSRRFEVWNGEERIGEIAHIRWYSNRARIDLPDAWPLGLQVFVFWVVLTFWQRDRSSSGSNT